jgi:hypothetical protein
MRPLCKPKFLFFCSSLLFEEGKQRDSSPPKSRGVAPNGHLQERERMVCQTRMEPCHVVRVNSSSVTTSPPSTIQNAIWHYLNNEYCGCQWAPEVYTKDNFSFLFLTFQLFAIAVKFT